jgi:hypothetical protein
MTARISLIQPAERLRRTDNLAESLQPAQGSAETVGRTGCLPVVMPVQGW